MRPGYLILTLLLAPACSFDFGFDGTRYQCGEGDRCPAGQSCMAGVCTADPDADVPDDGPDPGDGPGVDATDGATPAPVCGNLSLLTDTFDQSGTGPFWTSFADTGASVTETAGDLVINLPAGTTAYAGYIARFFHDLHGGAMEIQVDEVAGDDTILELRNHLGNVAQLVHEGNNVAALTLNVSGAATHATRVWNPAEKFWRIREDGGDMVWELSTDRSSWSELHRRPLPFPVEFVRGVVSAGGSAPATSRARYADVNPAGSPVGYCGAGMLHDDFAAAPLGPLWDVYADTQCTINESGGQLVLTYTGTTNNSFCGMESLNMWDVSHGEAVALDGSGFPSQTTFVSYFQLNPPINDNTRVEFTVDGNLFEARSYVNDVEQAVKSVAVDRVTHKFWRIRGDGNTAIWDTSPNGTTWNEFFRRTVTWDLSQVVINIGAGNYGTSQAVTIRVPGINAP